MVLLGFLPLRVFGNDMIQKMVLSIKTTASCQNSCSFCPVVPWMEKNKGFETSIKDINDLIYYTKNSGYHFKRIILSGGEPLLWNYIKECLWLLKHSGISDDLYMYTNALAVNENNIEEFKEICELLDGVNVSKYDNNHENIDLILAENITNITIIKREKYYDITEKPIKNSLPADCGCKAFGMIGNIITLCSFQNHMIEYKGWDLEDYKDQMVELGENYLEPFENTNPFTREMCSYCIGNLKVKNNEL